MIGPLYPQTKSGEALTPLKSPIIPKGFVFLKGTHPFSLDSRYEEFGLVSVNDIQGYCWGFGRRV
jgi:conjugal transfer pilin signal peptidase TrbI